MERFRMAVSGVSSFERRKTLAVWVTKGLAVIVLASAVMASLADAKLRKEDSRRREQLVRILGTTFDRSHEPIGAVAELIVAVEQRDDHHGLEITFEAEPGRFSAMAQAASLSAIIYTAKAASLDPDSLTVRLTVPAPGVTLYGESLSAMVGLTVVALAKNDFVPPDRVITGTVTPSGHIGTVGGIPLKLEGAHRMNLHRVLIPEEADVADGDWETPFLMQVSPVGTVSRAYKALTGRPLQPTSASRSSEGGN